MTAPLCIMGHGVRPDGQREQRQADTGLLCTHHRHRLTTTVAAVRDLWIDLQFIAEAGSAPKDDTPKTAYVKSPEAPAPANLEVLSLRDKRSHTSSHLAGDSSTPIPSVVAIVASWTLLLAEERPLTAKLPQSTIGQTNLLIRHGDWMAAQDWVEDYLREFTELRKALSAALRDHTHREIGRCRLPTEQSQACGGALVMENGSDVVKCSACRAAWITPQERARLAVSLETA